MQYFLMFNHEAFMTTNKTTLMTMMRNHGALRIRRQDITFNKSPNKIMGEYYGLDKVDPEYAHLGLDAQVKICQHDSLCKRLWPTPEDRLEEKMVIDLRHGVTILCATIKAQIVAERLQHFGRATYNQDTKQLTWISSAPPPPKEY